jgi:type II secretory ATPase GspE/PulE/Tfp pilus assembly ATPase PilB-like protein
MGIEPYLLAPAVAGIVAQRLARTLCPACETRYHPSKQVLADAGLSEHAGRPFRKGAGCRQCHDSGFQGRLGVYELMEVTPAIRRLIHDGSPVHAIREKVRQGGGLTLREEGVLLALAGKTSLEEILRVTHDDSEDGTTPVAQRCLLPAPTQGRDAA